MLLLELYDLTEMARTRGDATWAMLDWAAKNPNDFTIDDAYRVFSKAGGMSNATAFATIFNRLVAKYDPHATKPRYRDKAEYGLSQDRPIAIVRQGRRGKGGAAFYRWGLDGPLREPPAMDSGVQDDGGDEDDHVGDAIDKLERSMGRPALKAALERWRGMNGDHRRISADIRATVRPRDQMNAFLVATQGSAPTGGGGPVTLPDEPERTGTPFSPGKPRADLPVPQPPGRRTPAPAPEEPDDEPNTDFDDEEKTDPDMAPPDFGDEGGREEPAEDDGAGESETGGDEDEGEEESFDTSDYPDWLPEARSRGSAGQRAMYRLVAPKEEGGAGIQPASKLWRAIEESDDADDARERLEALFARSKADRKFLEDAIAVASDVLGGGGDDDEEGDDDDGGDEPEEADDEGDGGEDGDGDSDPSEGEEGDDEGEGTAPESGGKLPWLPVADAEGSRAENAMYRLSSEFGIDRRQGFYAGLRDAKDAVDAHRFIKSSNIPQAAQRYALVVAKDIFARDGRDWDTGKKLPGGPRHESRLMRLYREMTDDDVVPDPSRRGRVGVDRVMPDFGMDEAQLDPVDFAVRRGIGRIMRDRRR